MRQPPINDGTLSDGDLNSPFRFANTEEEETPQPKTAGFFGSSRSLALARRLGSVHSLDRLQGAVQTHTRASFFIREANSSRICCIRTTRSTCSFTCAGCLLRDVR